MPKKFDPDERFTLHPHEGEEVIKKVLDTPKGEPPDEDEAEDPSPA